MNFTRPEGRNVVPTATSFGTSPQRCVQELFEAQAARTPNAVAVTCEKDMLTYAQLSARANQTAHWLQEHGVKPDKLVGLCVEPSLDAVVALLGILKAGAAYVPLDPAFPKERLAQILEDARPEVMITQPATARLVSSYVKPTLSMSTPELASLSGENPGNDVQPHNLAYVIFTTGSTGRPKGVQIEHRALVNFLQSMAGEPGLTAEDTLLAVTTLSFDIAGLEILLPLIQGAHLVIASRTVVLDGMALRRLLETSNATVMQATPITWRILLESGWQGSERLKVLCGGEAMPPDLARELIPRCSSLWNLYGPTETTIWSTVSRVRSVEGRIPIGKPIANTHAYIVDRQLCPVPVGVTGELLIGGDGLARGYLNLPEVTAERFIPNPFSEDKAARVYKTGDLCQWRLDGAIDYLGRNDRQVKIRGHRIELGEIEAALASHPGVKQAVAKVGNGVGGEKILIGYVVASGVQPMELRNYLAQRLPEYMLPSIYVNLPELPLTPNRKLDWNALPIPSDACTMAGNGKHTSPRTVIERRVSEIAADLLGLEQVGIGDNFFLIGGHSVFCAQLIARIRDNFGIELPLRSVFESPTSSQLAQQIESVAATKIGAMSADEGQHAWQQANFGGGQE